MVLLNKEEAQAIVGGKREQIYKKCIVMVGDMTIWLCENIEVSCPGTFTYKCGLDDIGCSANFSTTTF